MEFKSCFHEGDCVPMTPNYLDLGCLDCTTQVAQRGGVKRHFEAPAEGGHTLISRQGPLGSTPGRLWCPVTHAVWECHRPHHHLSHKGVSQAAEARAPLSTFTASDAHGDSWSNKAKS